MVVRAATSIVRFLSCQRMDMMAAAAAATAKYSVSVARPMVRQVRWRIRLSLLLEYNRSR